MTFPPNLLTGAQAETHLVGVFLGWGWLPGKDVVDLGYDLSVEPERAVFRGARFLVQSKGTLSKTKRALTAQVDKGRLRSYFENPHPVFICRVLSDKRVLWVHAQDWCMKNSDRLAGSGTTGVKFNPEHDLSDRALFTEYLRPLLTPASEQINGLTKVATQRAAFLSGLDERLAVDVSYVDGRETYVIKAKEGVTGLHGNFRLDPDAGPENAAKFQNAFEFGLPAEVQVLDVHMTGSPLFTELGSDQPSPGTVTFSSRSNSPVTVLLAGGESYRLTAKTKGFESLLHRGHKGSMVINDQVPSVFDLAVKLTQQSASTMKAQLTLGIRESAVVGHSLRTLHELDGLVEWVDQIDVAGSIFFGLVIDGKRVSSTVSHDQLLDMFHILHTTRQLSKLHAICNYANCDLLLPSDHAFTSNDVLCIDLIYSALRGERVPIDVESVDVTLEKQLGSEMNGADFSLPTSIDLTLHGQNVGSFPVIVDVLGYQWVEVDAPLKWKLLRKPGSTALLRLGSEDPDSFKWVVRVPSNPMPT